MSGERILSDTVALLVYISVGILVRSAIKTVVSILSLCTGS